MDSLNEESPRLQPGECQTNEPPLECPMTIFGGLQDIEVSYDHLEAWANQTSASFSLQLLPDNHFFLHSAQSLLLQSLAQKLHQQAQAQSLANRSYDCY